MTLHHMGIVVERLEDEIPLWQAWMGAIPVGGIVEDETQGARIQLLALNEDTLMELIEPIPGMPTPHTATGEYHLCYTVPDLDAETARLHQLGALVAHPTGTAPMFGNRRLGFLATHSGQLLELLEDTSMPTM